MDTTSVLKDIIVDRISNILPECKILYLYNATSDIHFFQIQGYSIYADDSVMTLIDDIYIYIESQYPHITAAIVDESALSDLSHAQTIYDGTLSIQLPLNSLRYSFPIDTDLFEFRQRSKYFDLNMFNIGEGLISSDITFDLNIPVLTFDSFYNREFASPALTIILDSIEYKNKSTLWDNTYSELSDELEKSAGFDTGNEVLLMAA